MHIYGGVWRALTVSVAALTTGIVNASAQNHKDSASHLQEVVVTGQYIPQSLRNSVYKVRVINQQRIQMRGATDIAGVLNNELGVRFSTDYTLGETDISLMGLGGQRVKILLDGIPLVDRDAARQSLSQIDINSVERIEIVEGPMSVVYGTDAMAGVINIITRKNKALKQSLLVTARVQEETMGNTYAPFTDKGIHNENVSVNWQRGKWNVSGYVTRNDIGGWNDSLPYPSKVSKPKKQWMGGGSFGYQHKGFSAWYRLDYLHEELFSAGAMSESSYIGFDQYYITHRYTHQLQTDWQLNPQLKLNTSLSYQNYQRNTASYSIDYRAQTKTVAEGDGYWDISRFKAWFFRSTAQWFISDKVSVQPGIEFKNDKGDGQRINGHPSITDYSVFASAEIKPAAALTIRPGVRLSKNSVYDAPPVIPSINTRLALSEQLDVRLSYAKGFRAPALRELYFLFNDASHNIIGNPDLKAEYSNSFMGSVNWHNKTSAPIQFNSALSVFYNTYKDFIDYAYDYSTSPVSTTYINVSKYKTTGGTLENTITWKQLTATAGFSYIGRYNQYKENDQSLPEFTWTPEVNSNISYSFTKLKAQLGIFYKYTGALPTYAINSNNGEIYLSKIYAYHWADVTATKQIFKYLSLQAGIKNLFGVKRVANSSLDVGQAHSTGGPVLTGFGRSYFAGLNFRFSKN
ncbi:outer membrane receptor for ferrienterochelin and colicins [Filimonas lacunae]|uniref:Outer membrane receptor for ferrienterochelin and colicins n=1 Tax=Filimonas lacunae TaxID=477680 RepID=A0A173MC13_9BACT|nr:TonB-dependent receptor [Filimonas lacunae]BAV05066.1 TonB-dependent receptor [Filimonas lacunae]SIT34284.1 outer membrane receptor for ferrienterochelin and colicins [Filimonas lacunae]